MARIGHDTDLMRDWANTMKSYADEYDTKIGELYKLVDDFVQTDFTGGVSAEFNSMVLGKRADFNKLFESINAFADDITSRAGNIDSDTSDLVSGIRRA